MNDVSIHLLQTAVHGRYLFRPSSGTATAPLFAGFHGYGETAEDEMARLVSIAGSSGWSLCSIEALHRFRNAKGASGASWMTSHQRDLRIVENAAYVDAVLDEAMRHCGSSGPLVLHGFSQGAAMASRAAVLGRHAVCAVMLLGGDIPPELDGLGRMGLVHFARGSRDPLFAEAAFMRDVSRLADAGVPCRAVTFTGSHGANEEYFRRAGEFLGQFSDQRSSPCSTARRDLPNCIPPRGGPRPAPHAPGRQNAT